MKPGWYFAALAVFAAAAPAADNAAPFWTAICRGETDANYEQTVGGTGVFNTGNGDGSYATWTLHQTFYDGNTVCGAVKGSENLTQVCADNNRQVIILKTRDPKRPKAPMVAHDYCRALVKIH
jgi:hypothetical protein